jgi:sulfide:quinone oxidoreductase
MEIKMNTHPITSDFSVGQQIQPEDVATLAKQGFTTIICNRPDGEDMMQPTFEDIREEADVHGIVAHYVPIHHGGIGEDEIERFTSAMNKSEGPVFAYCRSGARSVTMWTITSVQNGTPVDDVLKATQQAGYDMSGLLSRLAS